MALPTRSDTISAVIYAENQFLKQEILKLQKLNDEFFLGVETSHRPWLPDEINLNGLAGPIKEKTIWKYTKLGCELQSCFSTNKENKVCSLNAPEEKYSLDDNEIVACQKACTYYRDGKNKIVIPEVIWKNGSCIISNTPLKKFCLFPSLRAKSFTKGLTDVPPFYWNEPEQKCFVTSKYCNFFNSFLINGDCDVGAFLNFFETWILGKTMTRELIGLSINLPGPITSTSQTTFKAPLLNKLDIKHETMDQVLKQSKLNEYAYKASDSSDKIDINGLIKELAITMSEFLGVQLSITLVKIFAKQALKLLSNVAIQNSLRIILQTAGKGLLETLLRTLITESILKATIGVASAIAKTTLSFVSGFVDPLLWILTIISVVGVIIDLVDPGGYNKQFGKKELDNYNKSFNSKFKNLYGKGATIDVEFSPDVAFYLKQNETSSDLLGSKIIFMAEYLKLLRVNSLGQVINYGPVSPIYENGIPETIFTDLNLIDPVQVEEETNLLFKSIQTRNPYTNKMLLSGAATAILFFVCFQKNVIFKIITLFIFFIFTFYFIQYNKNLFINLTNQYQFMEHMLKISKQL